MNYSTLANTLGFSKYNPNGIQLLSGGRLLLKISERSSVYNDLIDRTGIEISYDGHLEGARSSRNNVVRNFLRVSPNSNPRIILAIGRFPAGKKSGPLIWSCDYSVCLRGIINKGFGVSPEFVLSPVFKLEWNRFRVRTPLLGISDSRHSEGPGHEDCHRPIVYILSNPSQQGLLKIGKSIHLKSRLGVLNTSVPMSFRLEAYEEFATRDRMDKAEKEVHRLLDSMRVNPKKEFFRCSVQHAVNVLKIVKQS